MPGTAHAKTRRLFVLFFVVAMIAGAQETLQLLYKQRPLGGAKTFDLATDVERMPWVWWHCGHGTG